MVVWPCEVVSFRSCVQGASIVTEADCTFPADTLDMSVGGVLPATASGGTLGIGPREAVLTIERRDVGFQHSTSKCILSIKYEIRSAERRLVLLLNQEKAESCSH